MKLTVFYVDIMLNVYHKRGQLACIRGVLSLGLIYIVHQACLYETLMAR